MKNRLTQQGKSLLEQYRQEINGLAADFYDTESRLHSGRVIGVAWRLGDVVFTVQNYGLHLVSIDRIRR